MVLIVLLLMAQAYCDLTLPAYTSDIVDVGIQQGGIENAVPVKLRAETHGAIGRADDPGRGGAGGARPTKLDADGNYV